MAGVEVVVLNSDYDTEKEITNIKTLIDMGVDGMCIFSFNPNGAFIAARECAAAGVPLVVTDNVGQVLTSPDEIVACIDFDWKGMGVNVAEYIANNYPGEKIAIIMGLFEHIPVQMFRESFEPKVAEWERMKLACEMVNILPLWLLTRLKTLSNPGMTSLFSSSLMKKWEQQ